MTGTISLADFSQQRGGTETFDLEAVEDQPSGLRFSFVRGIDERTRVALRYRVEMTPGAQSGSWTGQDDRGLIENVRRDGSIITGVWSEAGRRRSVRVELKDHVRAEVQAEQAG